MRRYSAAHARQHLSNVLDEAEAGEPVVIERRGVRFAIVAQGAPKRARRIPRLIDWVDEVVASGNWTWVWRKGTVSVRKPVKKK